MTPCIMECFVIGQESVNLEKTGFEKVLSKILYM